MSAQVCPTVNIVVDAQFGGDKEMSPAQEAYLKKLSKSVADLREAGIPTIWISMSDVSKLHIPNGNAQPGAPRHGASELDRLDFIAHEVDRNGNRTSGISEKNAEFIDRFGPRSDEVLFQKAFFDAFTTPQDVDKLEDHLKSQRPEKYAIDVRSAFDGPALQDHLQRLGVQHVTIMGGNSDCCVMSTAMGAALNGLQSTILTDRLVSRDDPNGEKPAAWHEQKVKEKLHKIVDDPAALKGDPTHEAYSKAPLLSGAEKEKIRTTIGYSKVDDFLHARAAHKTGLTSADANKSRFLSNSAAAHTIPSAGKNPVKSAPKHI